MKCPLCDKEFLLEMDGDSRYFFCTSCHLGRLKKIPTADYSGDYYKASSSLARRAFVPIENFFYNQRTAYADGVSLDTWMDVGAGDGGYLVTVPAKKRIGVEVSLSGRKQMEKKGLIAFSQSQYEQGKPQGASVVSFWHVLEHVTEPWEYLRLARRNLKPEGKLIIAVPNIDSFEYKVFHDKWFHLVPRYHLWHFSVKSMKKLLYQNGFRIISIDYLSMEHHLTGILQSFINWTSGTDAALQRLVKRADGRSGMNTSAIAWSLFWVSFGAPIIFGFWILQVIMKRPSTFVMVAAKSPGYTKISSTPR